MRACLEVILLECTAWCLQHLITLRHIYHPAGKPFKPHEVLCFSMCPCFMPPLCGQDRKGAYLRLLRTACFWFSILQIIAWGISLYWRGFAPSDINPMIGPWPDTLDLMQAKNAARIKYWCVAHPGQPQL